MHIFLKYYVLVRYMPLNFKLPQNRLLAVIGLNKLHCGGKVNFGCPITLRIQTQATTSTSWTICKQRKPLTPISSWPLPLSDLSAMAKLVAKHLLDLAKEPGLLRQPATCCCLLFQTPDTPTTHHTKSSEETVCRDRN